MWFDVSNVCNILGLKENVDVWIDPEKWEVNYRDEEVAKKVHELLEIDEPIA